MNLTSSDPHSHILFRHEHEELKFYDKAALLSDVEAHIASGIDVAPGSIAAGSIAPRSVAPGRIIASRSLFRPHFFEHPMFPGVFPQTVSPACAVSHNLVSERDQGECSKPKDEHE